MKYRNGFVSNSSSSSFVVKFDKDPTVLENLIEMMGECGTSLGYYDDRELSTDDVIKQVHKDLLSGDAKRGDCVDIDHWEYYHLAEIISEDIHPYDHDLDWASAHEAFVNAKQTGFKTMFGTQIEPYTGVADYGYSSAEDYMYGYYDGRGWWYDLSVEEHHEFASRVLGAVSLIVKVARGEIQFVSEQDENDFTYTFEYGDDNGWYYSLLEHGGVFRNVEHRRVSHH